MKNPTKKRNLQQSSEVDSSEAPHISTYGAAGAVNSSVDRSCGKKKRPNLRIKNFLDSSSSNASLSENTTGSNPVLRKPTKRPSIRIRNFLASSPRNKGAASTASSISTIPTVVIGLGMMSYFDKEYVDLGDPDYKCQHCDAICWFNERGEMDYNPKNPTFSKCCMKGRVWLPPMPDLPPNFDALLYGSSAKSKLFIDNIRAFNMMFSFTSMGGKVDYSINQGNSPPIFKLHGQNHHYIGSLLPPEGSSPKFAQLYIYDTEHEVSNRMRTMSQFPASSVLHAEIVAELQKMLDEHNILVQSFRMARDTMREANCPEIKLRLIGSRDMEGPNYCIPEKNDIAVLVVGDIETQPGQRDIVIETRSGELQRITELHPSYLALQYPLIFLFGQDGYRENMKLRGKVSTSSRARENISMRDYFVYRIQERDRESKNILFSRRLFQQFLVDAYTMVESGRLLYARLNQKDLRCEMYKGLTEALLDGETNPSSRGKRVCLPSTFVGGARYMIQNYQDALALCCWYGYPNLFITFTANTKWPEVVRFLKKRRLNPEDRADVMCKIFKMKLNHFINEVRNEEIFGPVRAVLYTIEFQQRGLPHAHILLWLERFQGNCTSDNVDEIISAEIPDKINDPVYYEAVKELMLHGPCGTARASSPCMSEGSCKKKFPKPFADVTVIDDDGYPIYRRRNDGRTVNVKGVELDNRYVVPHNRQLLMKYGAHINVEWCNRSKSIKYLFKYVSKGNDRVTVVFYHHAAEDASRDTTDEIKNYLDCRVISPCEAAWRLFSYDIHFRVPSVERLSFHLPDEQAVFFGDNDDIAKVINRPTARHSMFTSWLETNQKYDEARELTYAQFPNKFVWDSSIREWTPRKKGFSIGRMFYVAPGQGELYYLRTLLNIVKGPMSFEHIRYINGVQYSSFRDACYALGLLDDDKEYIDGLEEASHWGSATFLRDLFATLLMSGTLSRPEFVWQSCLQYLSDDILSYRRKVLQHDGLRLSVDEIANLTLWELEKLLRNRGKSLKDFPSMPYPSDYDSSKLENQLICDELMYDKVALTEEHQVLLNLCTDEQSRVYKTIMDDVDCCRGGVYFVYGCGGTGKTFVWKTLSSALRSRGEIVLNVASSGIASLLLPNGRTGHSRFAIPLNLNEDSTCNIKQGSCLAQLIERSKLIIWDEAPMVNKHCFEALDKSLRDIMSLSNPRSVDQPFGGKTIVFGGDFRQILPVVPGGTRQDIVMATINSSYLWAYCKVLRLTKNMRLQSLPDQESVNEQKSFAEWILSIGDGTFGGENDGVATIKVPQDLLLTPSDNLIEAIVDSTYPGFLNSGNDMSFLQGRAILAPTLDVVTSINDYMVAKNSENEKTYFSSDSICKSEKNTSLFDKLHTTEFLNTIKCSGLPSHELHLKIGVPVMLMRNIDHSAGLCNGTRLIVTQLGKHIVEATILTGINVGGKVYIPRLTLTPSDIRLPFKFQRRQFPLVVCYAMTINKSQGQSLSHVGLFLKKPVFSHGQLYVAVSRVTNRCGLKMLISGEDGKATSETTNVVFKEIFQNL